MTKPRTRSLNGASGRRHRGYAWRRLSRAAGSETVQTGWGHFEHEADFGVRGYGPTPEASFEQAAHALVHVIADPSQVEARAEIEVACEAPDRELLLADWLNALVFEMATRSMLFACFEVWIEGSHLRGKVWGEPIDGARRPAGVEVKGATYTALKVEQHADGTWMAQCIVDV